MRVWSAPVQILFVTAAIAPYHPPSETGDVSRALCKALRGLDHRVTVVAPLYSGTDPTSHSLARKLSTLDVSVGGKAHPCAVYEGRTTGGVDLTFVDSPVFGDAPAAQDDPAGRTAAVVLCKAAALVAERMQNRPDVVHALGYQGALAAPLCKATLEGIGTVISVSSSSPTGEGDADEIARWELPEPLAKLAGAGNILSTGIATCDRVVVDSSVALDAVADDKEQGPKTVAIPNAVDSSVWNAMTDPAIEARFDPANTAGKDRCKAALQLALELPLRPETPLLGVVGEGSDVAIARVAEKLLRNDVQVAVGIAGETPCDALSALCEQHDDKLKVVNVSEEEALHQLIAGSDLLMLSPEAGHTGTLHLCAQRYGAPPIVPDASLAAESVVDCDAQLETGSGFVYADEDASLGSALGRALSAHARTEDFQTLRKRVMNIDASWERAARRYEQVYRSAAPTPA